VGERRKILSKYYWTRFDWLCYI